MQITKPKTLLVLVALFVLGYLGAKQLFPTNRNASRYGQLVSPTPAHFGQYQPIEYSATELKNKLENNENIMVVDVRNPEEYQAGHVPGAINIPYTEREKLSELPDNQAVVVYCTHSTWRAPYAAYTLSKSGHPQVAILAGGVFWWEQEIGELESASNPSAGQVVPKPTNLAADSPTQITPALLSQRDFTPEELGFYDGQAGRPAYVAVEGVVYDLTESPLWQGGVHRPAIFAGFLEVKAGRDLTNWLKFSPHGKKNLERFPVVGKLVKD